MSGYLPDGCTQEACDRSANSGDEDYYCDWCEARVDDEHECPACDPSTGQIAEEIECPLCGRDRELINGVPYCEPCETTPESRYS